MSDAEFPWPIEVTPEDTLRHIIRTCARPAGKSRIGARPRWSIVSDLTGNGSTYAARLCVWAGTDPSEMVVRRK